MTLKRKPIKKLFIANRGEIARRIALSAHKLGIDSVAIYSGEQPHAFLLDAVTEFMHVDIENTALYLDPKKMLEIAKKAGCDAVHPGFGFLSENAGFAKACVDAGLIWVGPNSDAIAAMASKAAAKDIAVKAKVPVIPGLQNVTYDEKKPDHKTIEEFAKKAGYPLLFKAALGGGGKGMRIAHKAADIPEALQRASSEGLNSFGDATLIVERYLTKPRHVEVQIFGDEHGNVTAFGDRDCSLQRRHQKIIEEAPAPELTPATRKAMRDAAVQLAKSVKYSSAGTVEFLVDWAADARKQDPTPFFFLEMNTRLQVEHPVTEEVFGIDLVEWQLRVAQGEKLPEEFMQRESRGHSIELRIYAEDTLNNFLPAPGPVYAFMPAQAPGIRWEVGVDTSDTITANFDPMIAKLIATAENRPAAIARLVHCIESTLLAGPKNNLAFLREVLTKSSFKDGAIATDFIALESPAVIDSIRKQQTQVDTQLADVLRLLKANGPSGGTSTAGSDVPHLDIMQAAFGAKTVTRSESPKQALRIINQIQSQSPFLPKTQVVFGKALVQLDDQPNTPAWYVIARNPERTEYWLTHNAYSLVLSDVRASSAAGGSTGKADGQMTSPVPGKIIALRVEAGRTVAEGDILLVIESMKMEFEIRAARAGTIDKILKTKGEQVTAGDVLVTFAKAAKD